MRPWLYITVFYHFIKQQKKWGSSEKKDNCSRFSQKRICFEIRKDYLPDFLARQCARKCLAPCWSDRIRHGSRVRWYHHRCLQSVRHRWAATAADASHRWKAFVFRCKPSSAKTERSTWNSRRDQLLRSPEEKMLRIPIGALEPDKTEPFKNTRKMINSLIGSLLLQLCTITVRMMQYISCDSKLLGEE